MFGVFREIEAKYKKCPRYKSGDCCGKWHEKHLRNRREKIIVVSYMDGRPSKEIKAYSLQPTLLDWPNQWKMRFYESAEVTDASLEWKVITSETGDALKEIHSGEAETNLFDDYPIRINPITN